MLNRQNSLRAWLRQAVCGHQQQPTSAPRPSLHTAIQRSGVSEGQEGGSAGATGSNGLQHLMYRGGSREPLAADRACH
ncbi:hypothetical protein CgunFtcFv8_003389 [Champsocephalus gunnari]|uniref:Uncharacterized protein n=1 Tax=Champsocephalus gunnari TaxID=52237 RepID=A0AAN8DAR6_CHAGU|nr:hypothetical protein CgunFtcFv8_003389 [Champsocephalus gunnari]